MRRHQTDLVAWFQVAIGIAIIAWWTFAAATNAIVELNDGRTDIVFHIIAELVMAGLLIVAGVSIRRRGRTLVTTMVSGLALGTLLYSSINSPGYFAEQGAWWAVGMFAAIGVAAAVTAATLVKRSDEAEPSQPTTVAAGYGRTP